MSVFTLISPIFVFTVIIFLEPKYSTPNTDPFRPPWFVNDRFSGRIPKKFLLLLEFSNCLGMLKLVSFNSPFNSVFVYQLLFYLYQLSCHQEYIYIF